MPDKLLTVAQVTRKAQEKGKHRDGGGLFLHVHKPGQASWTYQFRLNGKTLWGTIGPLRLYPLALARARHAAFCRILKEEKRDPRKAVVITPATTTPIGGDAKGETLGDLLIRYLVKSAPHWKRSKALLEDLPRAKVEQLIRDGNAGKEPLSYTTTFNRREPQLMNAVAQSVNPLAFREAVETIWPANPATVERMVKRLGTLLEFQRTGKANGAAPKVINHPAMLYQEVPAFMGDLAERKTVGARALRFTILTAARTNETLEGTWGEIGEIDGAPVWILSAERMKADDRHVVPLTPEAITLLGPRRADDAPLFRGEAGGFPNAGVMWHALQKTKPHPLDKDGRKVVVHGFRTTFRSWAADCTDYPREIAEKALAHAVPGTEGDYNRAELLAKRRLLMGAWATFCTGSISYKWSGPAAR
jgi:integrase